MTGGAKSRVPRAAGYVHRLRAPGDGSTRVPDPLAPGSGVELGAAQARDFQAEQIVAGGDPGSAHRRHLVRRFGPQARFSHRCRKSAAGRNRPSGRRLSQKGWFTAPGIWPATASMGSTVPGIALGGARIHQQKRAGRAAAPRPPRRRSPRCVESAADEDTPSRACSGDNGSSPGLSRRRRRRSTP